MVISAGTVKVGGVVSLTVMIWIWVVVLPQSSVSVQVLVMISSPSHAPAATASVNVASSDVSQLSASSVTSPVIVTFAS